MTSTASAVSYPDVTVADRWFRPLCDGKKTVEGRVRKGKWADVKQGDVLMISSSAKRNDEKKAFSVTGVRTYPGFEAMLASEGLIHVLPGVRTLAKGVAEYRAFYDAEVESRSGVVALELRGGG